MASATLRAERTCTLASRAASALPGSRLLSLDAFRGLTILAMILVNNPGSRDEDGRYALLAHADWHNPTLADLIFPVFLFIMGASLAFSLRKYCSHDPTGSANRVAGRHRQTHAVASPIYGRIVRRTVVLVLLGLGITLFSHVVDYWFEHRASVGLATLRLSGTLQRIGIVYCAAALVALHLPVRRQIIVVAALLLGYWAVLAVLPNPGHSRANFSPAGNLVRAVDRAIVPDRHLWDQTTREPTDPEGILSTLPAAATALFGYWAGGLVQRRGASFDAALLLAGGGALCVAVAWAWSPVLPLNKKLWTSSFVLLSGGVSLVLLALSLLAFDLWKWHRLARPFQIAGVNALFAFVASCLVERFLQRMPIGNGSARDWLFGLLFQSWIPDVKLASLGYSLTVAAIWWLVLWVMFRRGWSIGA